MILYKSDLWAKFRVSTGWFKLDVSHSHFILAKFSTGLLMVGSCVVEDSSTLDDVTNYCVTAHCISAVRIHFSNDHFGAEKQSTLDSDGSRYGTFILRLAGRGWRNEIGRKVKRALRKFDAEDVTLRPLHKDDIASILEVIHRMQQRKRVNVAVSEAKLRWLFDLSKETYLAFGCFSSDGQLMAVRACVEQSDASWLDFIAASIDSQGSSYGVLALMLDTLEARGVSQFDFGGVDELHNPGVYNFKSAWGGKFVRRNRPKLLVNISVFGLKGSWLVGK